MRFNDLRRFTPRARRPYRGPSWIGSGVMQGSIGRWYNAFPFAICLTQDLPRLNAVHKLLWPAYSPSGTSSSNGEVLHWLPEKVTWPTSRNHGAVMSGNPGGLGWHPTGKNYSSEPIHATEMPSSAWGTRFVTASTDLAALNGMWPLLLTWFNFNPSMDK